MRTSGDRPQPTHGSAEMPKVSQRHSSIIEQIDVTVDQIPDDGISPQNRSRLLVMCGTSAMNLWTANQPQDTFRTPWTPTAPRCMEVKVGGRPCQSNGSGDDISKIDYAQAEDSDDVKHPNRPQGCNPSYPLSYPGCSTALLAGCPHLTSVAPMLVQRSIFWTRARVPA